MPKVVSFAKSDVGLVRSNNEDAFVLDPELNFWALADGMGGAASGEVASRIFTETTLEVFSKWGRAGEENFALVQKVFLLANERIFTRGKENPSHHGMGCTAELLAFFEQNFILGHVGDSRTYVYRLGQLRQLTRDHSLVQDQIDQGLITLAEARKHPLRHIISRAVGVEEKLAVDFIKGKSLPGDIFLLCSDGLSDTVEDSTIQKTLSLPLHLEKKGDKLIELARSSGGHDNITAVLCEVLPFP